MSMEFVYKKYKDSTGAKNKFLLNYYLEIVN